MPAHSSTPTPTLTVFTPTFNRAATLPRVYESLRRQTSGDFLWLVVTDGSTDETEALVTAWKAAGEVRIDYVYQENRGKHNAHNAAVGRARTELFLILDSDDELLPHAVEVIVSAWARIGPEDRPRIAGVWTLCRGADGEVIGGALPAEFVDASLQELEYRYKDSREMLPCFASAILRRHPFPSTPPGLCPYIPEEYVWGWITRTYAIRFLNVACSRVYYQQTGLSIMARKQYRLSHCIVYGYLGPLVNDLQWFWWAPLSFLYKAVQTARYGLFAGELFRLAQPIPWKAKLLVYCALPVAAVLLVRDRLSGRIAEELGHAP